MSKITKNKNINWHKWFSRGNHPILINDLVWQSFKFYPSLLKLPKFKYYKRDTSTYFIKNDYIKLENIITKQLNKNPQLVKYILKQADKIFLASEKHIRECKQINWEQTNKQKIYNETKKFLDNLILTFIYIYWPVWIDWFGKKLLAEEFKKIFGNNWESQYLIATQINKLTSNKKFHYKILKLAYLYKNKKITEKNLKKSCNKLAQEYGYLKNYLFAINPYSPNDIYRQIVKYAKKITGYPNWLVEYKKIKKEQQKIINQLTIKNKRICYIISDINFFRDERMAWWGKLIMDAYPLLKSCAKNFDLKYNQLIQLTYNEFHKKRNK